MPRSPLLSNITIVVVEDHSDIRYLIGEFLGSHGTKVITAGDAFVGLRAMALGGDCISSEPVTDLVRTESCHF